MAFCTTGTTRSPIPIEDCDVYPGYSSTGTFDQIYGRVCGPNGCNHPAKPDGYYQSQLNYYQTLLKARNILPFGFNWNEQLSPCCAIDRMKEMLRNN